MHCIGTLNEVVPFPSQKFLHPPVVIIHCKEFKSMMLKWPWMV